MNATLDWDELLAAPLLDELRHLVLRRFGVELGVVTADGTLVASNPALTGCIPALRPLVAGGVDATYECPLHRRRERCLPLASQGRSVAGIFYPPLAPDDARAGILDDLVTLVADEVGRLYQEELPRPAPVGRGRFDMIGKSAAIQELFRLLDKVCATDSTVLVTGENGTGKELIARAIHYHSARKGERFVVQNCSAFNDNLLDSELFGHKRGSFTGAVADKPGLFEVADRGTFFLDEIGDMSPVLQVKVLRVLQEGTFNPVGDTTTKKVDVRIIAATNRDLKTMVARGEFREDLYYRIHVINLQVPALRERREDIPLLVDFFFDRIASQKGQRPHRLTPSALQRLMEYNWPGNVRELENEVERLVVLSGSERLVEEELISPRILEARAADKRAPTASLPEAVDDLERSLIYDVLRRNHFNKTRAAAELKISRRNLIRKCQKYQISAR